MIPPISSTEPTVGNMPPGLYFCNEAQRVEPAHRPADIKTPEMLELALSYAGDGFPVFPCDPATKKPLSSHGYRDATTEEAQIRRWWDVHPDAMVGWPTKGFCVVDVDMPQGPDSLKRLEAVNGGTLPRTMTNRTPSGGIHYIFKTTEEVKNTASGIGVDLDIRGAGGYIILAGSVNADGKIYETIVDLPPAETPAGLIRIANSCKSGEAKRKLKDTPTAPARMTASDLTAYGKAALERECQSVGTAAEGTRNQALNDSAFSLGSLVAGGELPEGEVVAGLTIAAMQAGLSRAEADKTIRSGVDAGKLSPRQSPNQKTHYTTEALRSTLGKITEQGPPRNRFGFTSAADLCKNPAATKWLIKNFIPEESFILIFGVSGCGKTFYLLDVSLSIASQVQDCLGSQVKKHGPVFYLCGEGHSGLPKRIKAWCLYRGIDPETIKFFASKIAVDMLDPESVNDMIAGIDDLASVHGQPVLIGIDTVNRNMSGDENSTKDMSAFVAAVDYVKNKYQCSVYAAHHPGLGDTDRSRGSNALRGALDVEFKLSIVGDHKMLTCTKSKNTEPPAPAQFAAKIIELDEVDEDGQPITSLVFVPTDAPTKTSKSLSANSRLALDSLEFIHGDKSSVHLDEWRKEFYARSSADSIEAKKKSFQRARQDLLLNLKIANRDDQYWIFAVPGHSGT